MPRPRCGRGVIVRLPGRRHSMTSHPLDSGAGPETIDPLTDPSWDRRLAGHPEASFFHGTAWVRVLQETYGFKPAFLVQHDAGQYRAMIPAMEIDSWLTGRRGVALPFTDESGPLCDEPARFPEFFKRALAVARQRGWRYLECRGGRTLFPSAPASTSFFGHRLDLTPKEETLFATVDGSVRRAVRKGEQAGLTITFSQTPEATETFYQLLCRTRRKHGLPAQPYRFFANIQRHILAPNHGQVALAHHGSEPVAGAVFFHLGTSALYKFGASDETRQHLRANNLLMWEAIRWHAQRGFRSLDFGRTSVANSGLRRYKLGWGAVERTVDYVRYDLRRDEFVTVPDGAAGWHNQLFRALPISLSRLAGSVLYKHVA